MEPTDLPPIHGHGLWLLPDEESAVELKRLITGLAHALGGPTFEPHLTLRGRLPRNAPLSRVGELARRLRPMTVESVGVGVGEEPYRGMFLPVEKTTPLEAAWVSALHSFGPARAAPWQPHFSLFYGARPLAEKMQAMQALGRPPRLRCELQALARVAFRGPPESWVVEEVFRLE